MKRMINGTEYDIPTNPDGSLSADVIRREAGVPSDRPLVVQRADGTNLVVNPGDKVAVRPGDHFIDMASHTRGS